MYLELIGVNVPYELINPGEFAPMGPKGPDYMNT
jgi:hypothetical protein